MNEAMKIDNIASYAESNKFDLIKNSNVLYGQIDTKLWKYALFSGFATLDIKHLLLIVTSDNLTIVGLTITGDFTDSIVNIPTNNIEAFSFKKGMIQSTISFVSGTDKYKIKIPNFIAVAKWQKININSLIENKFYNLM